jgi:hypothetical protein
MSHAKNKPMNTNQVTSSALALAPGSAVRYKRRDTEDLGQLYVDHVYAMTAQKLYEKNAIAAELAWRDAQINELTSELRRWMDKHDVWMQRYAELLAANERERQELRDILGKPIDSSDMVDEIEALLSSPNVADEPRAPNTK